MACLCFTEWPMPFNEATAFPSDDCITLVFGKRVCNFKNVFWSLERQYQSCGHWLWHTLFPFNKVTGWCFHVSKRKQVKKASLLGYPVQNMSVALFYSVFPDITYFSCYGEHERTIVKAAFSWYRQPSIKLMVDTLAFCSQSATQHPKRNQEL